MRPDRAVIVYANKVRECALGTFRW
ncbi:MAG: hypothetical protein ACLRWQ_07535 [Flavonifractor plautii]